MRYSWRALWVLFPAGLLASQGALADSLATEAELRACGHGQEREITETSSRGPALRLTSISPADSSYVTSKTMVVAELAYDIDGFEPGKFELLGQFNDADFNASSGGMFEQHPELQYAHGAIRFCYPLHSIWSSPAAKWPLEIVFNLARRNDDGSFFVVAQSSVTRFNSHQTPIGAVTRAAPTAEQVAMRNAVETLHSSFVSIPGHIEACVAEHPALKSSLLPPLETWQRQYAALQEKVDELYLQLIRQRTPGITADGILVTLEAKRTALQQVLRQAPQALSEYNCGLMPGRFSDGTFDLSKRNPQEFALINSLPAKR